MAEMRDGPKWTDVAVVILTVGIVAASLLQWHEMHAGSTDTHDLALEAKAQADAARAQAEAATKSSEETHNLVEKAKEQAKTAGLTANAATSAAKTAADSLVLAERPWIKIKHRIVRPLTFDAPAWKSPVASIVIEDTIENVGSTVALNVFSWEDVIPVDPDHSTRTARARQSQWCDANRHPDPKGLSGYMLFPRDPFVQDSTVGPSMKIIQEAASSNKGGLSGKVGFVLVGCVCYRSSFEPMTRPLHETKFIYWLGDPQEHGGIQPFVEPHGVADKLQLVEFPDGFSAD
jgi:hypothetical protein